MKCKDCKYWDRQNCSSEKGIGSCRKLPPIVKVDDYGNDYWHWPITCSDDWCGEFKDKNKPDPTGNYPTLFEMCLSTRIINCLNWKFPQVTNAYELSLLSEKQLLPIRGFGKTSIREIKRKLQDYGLNLK